MRRAGSSRTAAMCTPCSWPASSREVGHGQPGGDERADGERVAGQERDARLEAGSAAGPGHQPAGRRCDPRLIGELGEVEDLAAGRRWRGDSATTIGSSIRSWRRSPPVLVSRLRGVLEADREMEAARPHARGQVVQPALLDCDAESDRRAGLGHRHGDDRRQGAGEGADAQLTTVLRRPIGQPPIREAQTLGDDVGMRRADPRPRV